MAPAYAIRQASIAIFGHGDDVAPMSENGEQPPQAQPIFDWTRTKTSRKERHMARMNSDTRKRYVYRMQDSPVGRLALVGSVDGLAAILWENERPGRVSIAIETEDAMHPVLAETGRQLDEYFDGRRREFALPLDMAGTAFQRKVWNALLTIPFGETRSYKDVARQIGNPDAVRAVGAANGRNPVSIVAPCHRVVGATGKLTGFAGGLDVKAWLLALEGARIDYKTLENMYDKRDG
jgi:methylated-DNA-[protein]-cysteine S-methyltransferase